LYTDHYTHQTSTSLRNTWHDYEENPGQNFATLLSGALVLLGIHMELQKHTPGTLVLQLKNIKLAFDVTANCYLRVGDSCSVLLNLA
jgi:hypothetical protein